MTRVYHSEPLNLNQEIQLDDFAAQHLSRVMRVKIGDGVRVFNQGGEFQASVSQIHKNEVFVTTTKRLEVNTESLLSTVLLQAVTRRERMDFAIQKATELGVNVIQPIMTQHCVVKLDASKESKKLRHWQGIARHASEQSGRLQIPQILPILSYKEALESIQNESTLKLIFALTQANNLCEIAVEQFQKVAFCIGPVGGFSPEEVTLAIDKNFQSVKLGPRVLRSETASVAALTAIQLLWGDLK